MGFPILGALAISAVGSLIGGKKASDASKKAAKIQSDASEKAQAAIMRGYEESRALMAPYARVGGASNDLMGRLMGVPGGSQFELPQAQQVPQEEQQQGPLGRWMQRARENKAAAAQQPPQGTMRDMFQRRGINEGPLPPEMMPAPGNGRLPQPQPLSQRFGPPGPPPQQQGWDPQMPPPEMYQPYRRTMGYQR